MANICSFEMRVKGTEDNCRSFIDALKQEGKYWIGRGAADEDIVQMYGYEGVECYAVIGWCKWSLDNSLVRTANSMRNNPDIWDIGKRVKAKEIIPITLKEAVEMFNVEIEAWSDECGCEFSEHIHYGNGYDINDCFAYREAEDEYGDWEPVVYPEGFYEFNI